MSEVPWGERVEEVPRRHRGDAAPGSGLGCFREFTLAAFAMLGQQIPPSVLFIARTVRGSRRFRTAAAFDL